MRIRAALVAKAALRHTPAGMAVAEAGFRYEDSVAEAGLLRQLGFEFAAVALGPVAMALEREPLGAALELGGFIAPRTRRSAKLVVHITEYARS